MAQSYEATRYYGQTRAFPCACPKGYIEVYTRNGWVQVPLGTPSDNGGAGSLVKAKK